MRRRDGALLGFAVILGLSVALVLGAEEEGGPPRAASRALEGAPEVRPADAAEVPVVAQPVAIVYKPPPRGAPRARVGGGVRGARAMPTPLALVPEHVALTSRSAPSLFWHIDGVPDDGVHVFFTLIEDGGREPLVEKKIPRPRTAGVQRVRLRDYGVQLRPGVIYQWSVSLVPDPSRRSHDLVALGYVERVSAPGIGAKDARAQAEAGLWYDALETLSDESERGRKSKEAGAERDGLLRQVGLEAAVR